MANCVDIFATITPKAAYFEACVQALKTLQVHTLKEPGCLRFDIFVNIEDDGKIYMVEQFADQASFDAHFTFDYTKAVFEKYSTWLAQPVQALKLKSVSK